MLKEDERNVILDFISDLTSVEITGIKEISDDWFLRVFVSSIFPSAPEPVDPLRFLQATAPQLVWPGNLSKPEQLDELLVCLLAVGVQSEAKDVVIGKMFAQTKETQEILRRVMTENVTSQTSDENVAPEMKTDDKLRREIGHLRRQLEAAEAENLRIRADFRKRETLLLQIVHNLGLKVGLNGLDV